MIFKTQMQKADLVSIHNGWFQTHYNGVLYQEYYPKFAEIKCAVSAKQLFEALNMLSVDDEFYMTLTPNFLMLADSLQEFVLKIEPVDEFKKLTMVQTKYYIDLRPLRAIRSFVTQDYPGLFFTPKYVEVLHPSMLVRETHEYHIEGVYSVPEFPAKVNVSLQASRFGLWINYSKDAKMCLGKLDIEKPETDPYFKGIEDSPFKPIPDVVCKRWVKCKRAIFTQQGLLLDDHILIEGIEGTGEYDGVLLGKVIRNCTHWCMNAEFLTFKNCSIYGVLENVEHT